MNRGVSGDLGRLGRLSLVQAAAVAILCVPAAGAQQPSFEAAPGTDGIVTEKLAPVTPEGDSSEDAGAAEGGSVAEGDSARFKPAPFKTPEAPMVPELIPPVETELKAGARLRELDKMTGEAETVEVAAGEEITVDRLRVRLEACRAPADNAEHGTIAFLKIWDSKDAAADPVFSGWMFAESPALSAMDDPRYDVWVINCTTASGEESSASR